MKSFFTRIKPDLEPNEQNDNMGNYLIGSWRLISYTDFQSKEVKPHWKEVWSFAAMDETETNGVYVCDYINLHSVVGKWVLNENSLRLIRKECKNDYIIAELTQKRLVLKNCRIDEDLLLLTFDRVV